MSRLSKNKRVLRTLKIKLLNTLMSHGKKSTTEKILLSSIKQIFKSNKFQLIGLLKLAFMNVTPMFKLNEQIIKKGKRKVKKQIPFFLTDDSNRVMNGLKTLKYTSKKTRGSSPFYKSLSLEIINLIEEESVSISNNNDLKRFLLSNRRYLSTFRW